MSLYFVHFIHIDLLEKLMYSYINGLFETLASVGVSVLDMKEVL